MLVSLFGVVCRENHLEAQIYGLISLPKASIISEYKVLREILWQFYGIHESFTFKFERDKLIVNPELTIASARNVNIKYCNTLIFTATANLSFLFEILILHICFRKHCIPLSLQSFCHT